MLSKMFVFLCLLVPLGANAATVAVGSTTINFNGSSATTSRYMTNHWSANPLALQGGSYPLTLAHLVTILAGMVTYAKGFTGDTSSNKNLKRTV